MHKVSSLNIPVSLEAIQSSSIFSNQFVSFFHLAFRSAIRVGDETNQAFRLDVRIANGGQHAFDVRVRVNLSEHIYADASEVGFWLF